MGDSIYWRSMSERVPLVQRTWAAGASERSDLNELVDGMTIEGNEYALFVLMSSAGCTMEELRWALMGRARVRFPGLTFSPFVA